MSFPHLPRFNSSPISYAYSPSLPPSPSVAAAGRMTQLRAHEDNLRVEYFALYLKDFDTAYDDGIILSWLRGQLKSEPWGCFLPNNYERPLNDNDRPILPEKLDEAFSLYNIPFPTCPCESQETGETSFKTRIWVVGLASDYAGEIAIGCQRRNCRMWKSLNAVFTHPELITVRYSKYASRGPGINNFDSQKISERVRNQTILPPTLPPTPFSRKTQKSGLSGVSKPKRPSNASKISKDKVEKMISNQAPIMSETLDVYLASAPPSNQLARCWEYPITDTSSIGGCDIFHLTSSTSFTSSHNNWPNFAKRPDDRFWDETLCLYFLPDAHDICWLNRDVPALCGDSLTRVFASFFSPEGVSKEELW
ncbi:hypothetical protein M422DRAFT_245947 [Sphaerobolus stellatus SS14]|nr:hypothetical protein M422DRAFT_245947 [Sphaerobolus stellatus SS14]